MLYKFVIIDCSKLRQYCKDSDEAADYILSLRSNYADTWYGGSSIATVSNNTYQRIKRSILNRDKASLKYLLDFGYDEAINKKRY